MTGQFQNGWALIGGDLLHINWGGICMNTKKPALWQEVGLELGGGINPVLTLSSMVICGHLEMSTNVRTHV